MSRAFLSVLVTVSVGGAMAPMPVGAHVKWFEDPTRYPLRTDLIASERTLLLVVAAAVVLCLLFVLQRAIGDPHWPRFGFLKQMAVGAPILLAVQAAISLVYAAVQPALLVPNMRLATDAVGLALGALQLFIAFSFITGLADWVAALALILLGPVGFLLFPAFDVLDQLHWVGIAIVILVVGRFAPDIGRQRPWFAAHGQGWSERAVVVMRVITGAALIAPALSEKIWNPDLGAAFLASHPEFNFPRMFLGQAWFSDDLFVLTAGLIEATIGVLLISGLLTRVVILGMWVPFNVGIPFLPPQELLGHLPIFGIMYVLLVHSSGADPRSTSHVPNNWVRM
jgi:hypothetical protein